MKQTFKMPSRWAEMPIRIALIGAGGSGSDMAVRLAKLHRQLIALGSPGLSVVVFDPDQVSATNVGRQHFSPSAIGLNKAISLVHSLNMAYALDWRAKPQAFDIERLSQHSGIDLLITCVDKAIFRAALCQRFQGVSMDTLVLDMGNGSDLGQVVLGHLGQPWSGLKLPNVYDLYPDLANMQAADEETPSCSAEEAMQRQSWPVNQTAALIAAELLWTLIRHGGIDYHGASFSLRPLTTTPMWIDPDAWAFFGYVAEDSQETLVA